MTFTKKTHFEFDSQVSPRYLEPLLIKLDAGVWYDTDELKTILRRNGPNVVGNAIVRNNIDSWHLTGLGCTRFVGNGRKRIKQFQLTELGKVVTDIFSTNHPLFFDLIHFLFYSTWQRSEDIRRVRFWLYAAVCDCLWDIAPVRTDTNHLANRLQIVVRDTFPEHNPAIRTRSVCAVFPWLGALTPPFLVKRSSTTQLDTQRRTHCSPQLFHLATDLIYVTESVKYGTSLAIGDQQIEGICKVCLLDPQHFWDMASLTQASIRDFEIRKGQWATSVALNGPPSWIKLPDFASESEPADSDETDEQYAENMEGDV